MAHPHPEWWPTPGLGAWVALLVLLVALILFALRQLSLEAALLVCAVAANRL